MGVPGRTAETMTDLRSFRHGPDVVVVLVRMEREAVRGARRIPLHEVAGLVHVRKEQGCRQLLGEGDGGLKHFGMLAGHVTPTSRGGGPLKRSGGILNCVPRAGD